MQTSIAIRGVARFLAFLLYPFVLMRHRWTQRRLARQFEWSLVRTDRSGGPPRYVFHKTYGDGRVEEHIAYKDGVDWRDEDGHAFQYLGGRHNIYNYLVNRHRFLEQRKRTP